MELMGDGMNDLQAVVYRPGPVRDKIDAKAIQKALGKGWGDPFPLGDDAWVIEGHRKRVIVSYDDQTEPGTEWIHASISHEDEYRMIGYGELKQTHQAVFGNGYSYQCFVPADKHINIRSNVLHLWGRFDGAPVLPDFGQHGTI
jgi:hypothetical protein